MFQINRDYRGTEVNANRKHRTDRQKDRDDRTSSKGPSNRTTPRDFQREEREIQVGDKVRIKNPGPFQEKEGRVVRVNQETGFVLVQGRRRKKTTTRKKKNLEKIAITRRNRKRSRQKGRR